MRRAMEARIRNREGGAVSDSSSSSSFSDSYENERRKREEEERRRREDEERRRKQQQQQARPAPEPKIEPLAAGAAREGSPSPTDNDFGTTGRRKKEVWNLFFS